MADDEKPAPWESAAAHEHLFALLTGVNSSVGLGVAQRLFDEFLATRPPTAHLVLVATTRSADKSREAVNELRAYLRRASRGDSVTVAAAEKEAPCTWRHAAARIHVLSLPLDLCDLESVRAFARTLVHGRVSNPGPAAGQGDDGDGDDDECPRQVRIPRLDCVIFNAAYGGWQGCNYPLAVWSMLTKGLVQSVTWPDYKKALPTALLNDQRDYDYPARPLLGQVFTACVFGHYMLAHELLPLLSRPASGEQAALPPARIVWTSSLEGVSRVLSPDDLQCLAGPAAYESAKRLTDVLALTHSLPAARPYASRWLRPDDDDERAPRLPGVYLTHPGILASAIFPVPWFLIWAYQLAVVLARWLGSPWHTVNGYTAAKAAVWIALEHHDALEDARAHRVKWGSASDRRFRALVKKTEVEGWGWEGRVQVVGGPDDHEAQSPFAVLRKSVGRKHGVVDVTAEDIVRFEELGAACWRQMEALRTTWRDILDARESAKHVRSGVHQ